MRKTAPMLRQLEQYFHDGHITLIPVCDDSFQKGSTPLEVYISNTLQDIPLQWAKPTGKVSSDLTDDECVLDKEWSRILLKQLHKRRVSIRPGNPPSF
eukprot:6483888-Amphidinium_carterae.1